MFKTEQQLVNTLKLNFSAICHWNTEKYTTKILEEVNLGFGIADMVITKVKRGNCENTTALSYFDAFLYKIIRSNKQITFEKLKELTKCDTTTLNRSLNKLIHDSYIKKTDHLVTLKNAYKGMESDSIAIEAKLKNWKRALDQAYRYKWFAKRAFVVLDSFYAKPAIENLIVFKKMNVGLAEINKEGVVKLHFSPLKNAPIDYTMWILLNEQLKQLTLRQKE